MRHRWYAVMSALALLLALSSPAAAGPFVDGPFPKSRNYMSQKGYARWQHFVATGVWR